MYRYIITPLLLCCLALPAAADDVQLQDNHPDRYVVVKGDTLWGISAKFLKDPWQWPKVWRMNREQIKNPHRIYPGDLVVLDTVNGMPHLSVLHETVTLQPGVIEEELEKEAVPTIAPNVIAPFLNQPLLVESNELDSSPTIIAGPDNRLVLSPGSSIYINKLNDGDGLLWHVYRPGKTFVDPETKENLGVEAIYLGDAKVKKYGEPATVELTRTKEEIFTLDKLVPAPEVIPNSFVPRAPDSEVRGLILSIVGGVAETGRNSVVVINRGSNDGLEEGHVLSISRAGRIIRDPTYKDSKGKPVSQAHVWDKKEAAPVRWKDYGAVNPVDVEKEKAEEAKAKLAAEKEAKELAAKIDPSLLKLPEERVGLLMVFRTFNRVSYALIMQSDEPIKINDIVKTP